MMPMRALTSLTISKHHMDRTSLAQGPAVMLAKINKLEEKMITEHAI